MTSNTSSPAAEAIKLAILQQVLLLPLVGLAMDGGGISLVVFFALSAYWGGVWLVRVRRRGHYTRFDLFLFRWGFFLLCPISFFVAQWIWKLRGHA